MRRGIVVGGDLRGVLDKKNVRIHSLKKAGKPVSPAVAVRGRSSVPGTLRRGRGRQTRG